MQLTGQDKSQDFSPIPTDELFLEDEDIEKAPQKVPTRASGARPDLPPSGNPVQGRALRSYEDEPDKTAPQGSGTGRTAAPAHGVQGAPPKPGHIVDALRMALDGSDFTDWAGQIPDNVKDEILAKVMEAFGKVADKKQA